ncbi:MAG: NAD(P)/FAD-dependent oxidoreductase [Planctomycetes bacterium]|nr:NAD(P)/FAD-dependent oxidoreductase [Planctomycetota bacterium]
MPDTFDVLILGAGPAGSSLAIRMARAGFSVALADRKRFPRPKPCGEFLSPECVPLLDDLGIDDLVSNHGAREVAGMRLFGYEHAAVGFFRDVGRSATPFAGGGLAIRREILDHELVLEAERNPNVTWLEGHTFHSLVRDGSQRVVGAVLRAPDRSDREIRARWTVGADGVRSRAARELGVQRRIGWLDKFALTSRFSNVTTASTAEVHMFPGGYFAAAPVEEGTLSVNLIVDRGRLRERDGDWDDFFAEHLARVPEFAERLQAAVRTDPVRGIGPLAYTTTAQTAPGIALVGDACGYVDPITGEGVYFALRGAELLAEGLETALHQPAAEARTMRRYTRARRHEIGPRLWVAKLLQRGLRHEGITRRVLGALESRPGLADLLVSFTGDYVRFRDVLRPGVWRRALSVREAS